MPRERHPTCQSMFPQFSAYHDPFTLSQSLLMSFSASCLQSLKCEIHWSCSEMSTIFNIFLSAAVAIERSMWRDQTSAAFNGEKTNARLVPPACWWKKCAVRSSLSRFRPRVAEMLRSQQCGRLLSNVSGDERFRRVLMMEMVVSAPCHLTFAARGNAGKHDDRPRD